jgi:hypothetical protein
MAIFSPLETIVDRGIPSGNMMRANGGKLENYAAAGTGESLAGFLLLISSKRW